MATYEDYITTVRQLYTLIRDDIIYTIAKEGFEEETGYKLTQTLPDKQSEVTVEINGTGADVFPEERRCYNPYISGESFSEQTFSAEPETFLDDIDVLYDAYWEAAGEWRHTSNQPDHPGEPPITKDALRDTVEQLHAHKQLLAENPTLADAIGAIEDQNYKLAAQFFNIDDPQEIFTPGGAHELTDLFTQTAVHTVYRDDEIALLKAEINEEARESVLRGQAEREIREQRRWGGAFRVNIDLETAEFGYVVGLDDTPTGLFAHSVDGMNLDEEQSVTREYIHRVMGFDQNYTHSTDVLTLDEGERVRLQGDLAMVYEGETDVEDASRCNLPIDNHLVILNNATLADGESRAEEPIQVHIPSLTPMNVVHDEHDNVTVDVPAGVYTLYLLPRGLRPQEIRPRWPEERKRPHTRQAPTRETQSE